MATKTTKKETTKPSRWRRLGDRVDRLCDRLYLPALWVIALTLIIGSVYGLGDVDGLFREGIRIGVPLLAVTWAVCQPWIAKRQADARRDEERHELRVAAVRMSEIAVDYLDGVRDHYWRYANVDEIDYLPHLRFDEYIELLGAFKPDKMPNATMLVAIESLRGALRRAKAATEARDTWLDLSPNLKLESKLFGPISAAMAEQIAEILTGEVLSGRLLVEVMRKG